MNGADEVTRRNVIKAFAAGCLGVTVGDLAVAAESESGSPPPVGKKADAVIYIYMAGGMSHLDTFDPKPGTDEQGDMGVIRAANGEQFGQHLPKLADLSKEFAVIRSMNSREGSHERATYLIHTSYPPLPGIEHPSMGAWSVNLAGQRSEEIPNYIVVGSNDRALGSGFMGSKLMPVYLTDPSRGISNVQRRMSDRDFDKTLQLVEIVDSGFQSRYNSSSIDSYNEFYDRTLKLIASQDLAAFDLNQEPRESRDKFGSSRFGQGLLLARRLVQAGSRFIEVVDGGWDMHEDHMGRLEEKLPYVDQGVSALLADLKSNGLLDTTVVALVTEFGRSPEINARAGRDHHAKAWSTLLAGGGIQGGAVVGKTDKAGEEATDEPVSPQDFNATIATAMGLSHDKIVYDTNSGRPFRMSGLNGKPIVSIL